MSCAASTCWQQDAPVDSSYSSYDAWDAQRTAIWLRGEVLQDTAAPLTSQRYDLKPQSQSWNAITLKKKGMNVHFAKDATVHIMEETGPDISQAIPLQVDSLSSWPDKPWSLLPLELNHCRTPFEVETNNDSSVTAYDPRPVQHTPDSEVPVSGAIEWTNPLIGSTTASRYSEAIQEALYNNDLQHLTSIARVAQWSDRLHIKTYGHFEIDRGTKNLVISVSQAHEIHQQIAVLWHEWSNPQKIDIIPVVPQPDDMGIDLHLIVGHRIEHGHPMLVELRGEDPCRATVIVDRPVIAYDLIIKARGLLDDTASYITRKGGHIWQNFVPLPTSPGQYWTILQHRSDPDILHLMQTETTILPAKPDRGHWHRKAELPDEYLNLLEESDMVPHQQPLVRGPMIFEREEEWTRLLTLARHTMEQTIQIIIHGLYGEDIGTHHGTAQRLSRTEIEAMVDMRWPMLESFVKRIFIVFPQPDGFLVSSVTFLVEFQDPNDIPHQDVRPILEEVIRYQDESTYQTQRTALYLPTGSSFEHIVDGIPGCNPFEYDHRCDAWLGGIPVHLGDHPIIQNGQLLTVRLVPIDESPSEYLRAIFAGAANFEQFAIVASARLAMTELLWTFHLVGQMGEPHRTIVLNVPWIHSHSANYVVQQLRHTGQVAVDDAEFSCTLVRKNPLDFASLEFVCGPQPDSHCTVLVGFTAKWDEQYLEHHCYNLPCHTTALDIAGIFRLDRFSEWTIFVSGRPAPPDDMLHLRPGEYLEIELEDTSDEEKEEDEVDLMQQPRPTVSPNLVSVRLLGTHSTSVQVNLRNDEPMMQQLREDWPLMGRIAADLHALHPVSHPPSFVTAPPNEVYLMQFHADASDQVHTDDVLILLTVSFSAPHSIVHNKQRIRVVWGPKKTTRDQFLSYVRMQRHCASATVLCTLFHNNGLWAIQDSSLRNLRDGDHLRLQIRSDKEGWCDFEYSEESARRIRIFADSPPAEQSEGSEGGESLSPYSVRSRSRERSRTPEDANPGPPSPADLEDDPIEDTDSHSLLQVRATKQKGGRESQKILESHVLDRWCTLDQTVSTETPKKILELDALIEKNKDEKTTLYRSMALTVDHRDLMAHRQVCSQVTVSQRLPETVQKELTPVAMEWFQSCTDSKEPSKTYIFVDGSAKGGEKMEECYKTAAFSVVLFGEDEDSTERSFEGWAGGTVVADPPSTRADAITAERSAILLALQIVNGRIHQSSFEICFDNQAAGFGADGTWKTDQESELARKIRLYTVLIQQQGGQVGFQHVKAHSNQPQNDIADALAKQINQGKVNGTFRADPEKDVKTEALNQLLLVAGSGDNFPPIWDKTLMWKHEAKPAATSIDIPLATTRDRSWTTTKGERSHSLELRLMSYNVLTLRPWKVDGHDPEAAMMNKAALLAQQMVAQRVTIAGLQETRNSQSGVFQHDGVYRVVARGTRKGTHGCELWFNLMTPFATVAGKPLYIDPTRITVVESDVTKIFVQVEIPGLTITIGSVHAPHTGTDASNRQTWWKELSSSIAKHRKDVLFILGDFNATLPETMEDHVGTLICDKGNTNSGPLQQILVENKLWAPASYEACHQGTGHTWTHYTGKTSRLDYILVDRQIDEGACWSYPMKDIEIGNPIEDHEAIGMDIQWEWKSHHGLKSRKSIDWSEVGKKENANRVRELVGSIPNCQWNVDIHDHMQFVQDTVIEVLKTEFPLKKKTHRKTYISDETWRLRSYKLKLRAVLHDLRKQEDGHKLRFALEKLRQRGPTGRVRETVTVILAERMLVMTQRAMSQKLKKQLRKDRDDYVETIADDIRHANAIDVHKALDKLKGSSKFRKRGRQQLPMLIGEEGEAQSLQERAKLWQQRCSQLEVGYYTTVEQVRSRCRATSYQVAKSQPPPTIEDIPSILELEERLRRIKRGKAPGPDQIRSEVCAIATPEVAKLLYPILVKQALLLEEPIQARGGVLIPAYKGKGHHTALESYRSLLLSNHFGKSMRGVYRPKLQPFYTYGSSSLHFAAKPGGNVSHASHYMRSFHQVAKAQGWSSSSVFVDISSAFYRIIRQFAVTVRSSKEDLSRIFKVFDIPPEELDKLLHELNDRTALEEAKTTDRLQKVIGDYLEATWFTVPNNDEVIGTLAGSRPGDTFADLIFSFVFSKILDRITKAFECHGWRTTTPTSPGPSVEQRPYDVTQLPTFVQLTWADDLVILQKAERADQLVDRTRLATGLLCDICWRHGLEPNFSPGKTEGMLHLRGKGSAVEKKKYFDMESPEVIVPSTLRKRVTLKLVSKYKHLGFMVTTGHKIRAELNARLGQTRTAYNRHKKQVYENKAIPRIKRMRILGVQVLSILRYNLGTWPLLGAKDWQCYNGAVMRLYRGLAKAEMKEEVLRYWTDDRVCAFLGAPSPQVLLHEARLSYFASLVRSGPDELWALCHTNGPWYQAIEKAFEWLNYNTAGYHVEVDAMYRANNWINFIAQEQGQWKTWIRRARVHCIRQEAIKTHVQHWHDDFTEEVKSTGLQVPEEIYRQVDEREVEGQHACPRCKQVFRTKAAKAVHDFKKHGKVSNSRYYLHGTDCPRCHKQYHTSVRLQRHFYYSKECLEFVQKRDGPLRGGVKPGINNTSADQDRALPVPVGRLIGPEENNDMAEEDVPRGEQVGDSIDIDFMEAMVDILQRHDPTTPMETFDEEIRRAAQQSISDLPILLETLRTFGLEGREFPEIEEKYTENQLKTIIRSTVEQFSLEWAIPETTATVSNWRCRRAIYEWWKQQASFRWRDVQIPRPRSKMITFIHLYSGHRREGDVESHLAGFPMPEGCVLRCLSVDIIFDYDKGDLCNPATQKAWLAFAEDGQIDGALMGPPCHTFSTARECGGVAGQSDGDGGPRVIRTAEQIFGMAQTTPTEAEHLQVSNELLCFSLQLIAVIIRHLKWATLEHPADFDEGNKKVKGWRASIWKLPVVRALEAHPRVQVAKIWQGLFGAIAPKPMTLLHTGELHFEQTIQKGATHQMPPPLVMGKSSSHEFATAQLKAYPSDLCYRLAESFVNWVHHQQRDVQTLVEADAPFVQWTDAMVSNFNFSRQQGQDYGRGG